MFSRLSSGHVIMIVAGLLAVLVNFALLRARDDTVLVAIAARDIPTGTAVDPSYFEATEVKVAPEILERLLRVDGLATSQGAIAARTIPAGQLVIRSDLQSPAAPLELRAMSIPIDREHAVGGALAVNDRVDIIRVEDGVAEYVVVGAPVLAVPGDRTGAFQAVTGYHVVVAVDAITALELSSAIHQGSIEIVRSTGAAEPSQLRFDPATGGAVTPDTVSEGADAEGGG